MLLKEMEKAKGGQPHQKKSTGNSVLPVRTLDDMGISKKESSRWQQEADVPEEEFVAYVAEANEKGEDVTSAAV